MDDLLEKHQDALGFSPDQIEARSTTPPFDWKPPRTVVSSNVAISTPVPLARLIKHCERFMSDAMLAADFMDCLLPLAASAEDRDALNSYYLMRRRHKTFEKANRHSNNHGEIVERFWSSLEESQKDTTHCETCGKATPTGSRGQVKRFCSAKCRKAASRATRVAA